MAAKNATKIGGNTVVARNIEKVANAKGNLMNKAADVLSKVKNVNPNSTLGKVARFGRNVGRIGKFGLRFAPGVGTAILAVDAARLGRKMYKDRDKIASYLKNKSSNISNSIKEFGDNIEII